MEPLTTGAVAIVTVLATKALEKIGENIGDSLSNKTKQFLELLKKQKPDTVIAIEKVPEQPLDYGQAVLEVEAAAKADSNVNQAIQELAAAAKAEPNTNFHEKRDKLVDAIKLQIQQPSVINNQKLADQIKNVFQGNTFHNTTFN